MSFRFRAAIVAILAASALAACSGDKPGAAVAPDAPAVPGAEAGPLALAPHRSSPQSIVMPVNQEALAQAVERHRITKKKGRKHLRSGGRGFEQRWKGQSAGAVYR